MRQPDLFSTACGPVASAAPEVPEPDVIRARLGALLEVARAARTMPWDPPRARAQQHLFRNMARWLPEPEAERLHGAFLEEMNRLGGSGAA